MHNIWCKTGMALILEPWQHTKKTCGLGAKTPLRPCMPIKGTYWCQLCFRDFTVIILRLRSSTRKFWICTWLWRISDVETKNTLSAFRHACMAGARMFLIILICIFWLFKTNFNCKKSNNLEKCFDNKN